MWGILGVERMPIMMHTVQVEIPEDTYKILTKTAAEVGQPLEQLVAEWIVQASHRYSDDPLVKHIGAFHSKEETYDPMDDFIGSISTDMPGWGDRHDELIGEALYRELRGEDASSNLDA